MTYMQFLHDLNEEPPKHLIPHRSKFQFRVFNTATMLSKEKAKVIFRVFLRIIYTIDGRPTDHVGKELSYYYVPGWNEAADRISEHIGLPMIAERLPTLIGRIYNGQVNIAKHKDIWYNQVRLFYTVQNEQS